MRQGEDQPPKLEVLLNGVAISGPDGISYNATTPQTAPAPGGTFSFHFMCGHASPSPSPSPAAVGPGDFGQPRPPHPTDSDAARSCEARGIDYELDPFPLDAVGNYAYELVGDTVEQLQLRKKQQSSDLLSQLRRCFYFLQQGNAATYDSSQFCDACEGMSMFAEWTENRVRQQNCAGEFCIALVDALSEGIKGLPEVTSELQKLTTVRTTMSVA